MTYLVGVLEISSKYRYGITGHGAPMYLFRPYNETMPELVVGCAHRDKSRDQIAIVESMSCGKRGRLVRLLGCVGDPVAERMSILEHYCPERHRVSEDYHTVAADEDDAHREELSSATGWITFHIDPPGCRDIDDALAYNPVTKEWAITIADAAASVTAGSPVDTKARAIGATFYDPITGEVLRPMLPSAISAGSASLLPRERRRGVTWFPATGRWALTWITVEHSMTYDTFTGSPLAAVVDDEDSHALVERMMIAYNVAAAGLLKAAGTGIFRCQAAPDAAEMTHWITIDPALGRLAHEAATYSAEASEHAGLGLPAYCHASSPLRRYADLVNQRGLKAVIRGRAAYVPEEGLSDHLNARMRANKRCERDLMFLALVPPGRVHEIDVIWVDESRVWVPVWGRLIRLRHEVYIVPAPGTCGRINIFCDPTKRNWKRRILTAAS